MRLGYKGKCMAKFRKKPVTIEAEQLTEEIVVYTLEGDMRGNIGVGLLPE